MRHARHFIERDVHHPTHIFQRGTSSHGAKRDDLRDLFLAVFLDCVIDQHVALIIWEVHVDIRHRHALWVQETLEEQVVADRLNVGHHQGIADDRASSAATHIPPDVLFTAKSNQIPHDDHIAAKAHRDNRVDLELEALTQPLGGHGWAGIGRSQRQ